MIKPSMAVQQAVLRASHHLNVGDLVAAENLLVPLLIGRAPEVDVLHLMGVIRIHQQRLEEAVSFLSRANEAGPAQPQLLLNIGKVLARLGRLTEADAAFRAAIKLRPDLADAYCDLGNMLHQAGQIAEAEATYRELLRRIPSHGRAKLALGAVLIDAGRPVEAERPLRRGLVEQVEARLKGALHNNLAAALRRQSKNDEALENYEQAQSFDPALPNLDMHRAQTLEDLRRYDEAVTVYQELLAREPLNSAVHHAYNDLLYRAGKPDDYLKSYDRAPPAPSLQQDKALFLMQEKRAEEAYEIYRDMLARDPDDKYITRCAANALVLMKRHDEAADAFDTALRRFPRDFNLLCSAAAASMQQGDPQKALALCQQGISIAPDNQSCLANLGTALRMMEDGRDETLNGYDTLIQTFDLEPPKGFSSMESFNEELCVYLDRLHPDTREYISQSLRGGTQTPDHLFGSGHVLVDKLQARLTEALKRYIASLKDDEKHPFLSRRTRDFAYSGSWSSRLKDSGFHINHFHPGGWISSCYYVGVPDAAKDETGRQGWIKFGEPGFDVPLKKPVRRAIQPAPGRLVLFPSYMWHGTIAFHDVQARTTIAFDVVPVRS